MRHPIGAPGKGRVSVSVSSDATRFAGHGQERSAGGHPRRRLFPLSIRFSLVGLVLVPLVVAIGLATSVVVKQSSRRHQAVVARETSFTLDSLLTDRADLYAEYAPTLAIEEATVYGLTGAQLDKLLGVNFQADLVTARRNVDSRPDFGPGGLFASDSASAREPEAELRPGYRNAACYRAILQRARVDNRRSLERDVPAPFELQ